VAKRLRELSPSATKAVVRLRAASESLAGVVETVTFGNPTFKVKQKTIAVVDRYDERECLWLRVSPNERELLLDQCGWFPSPYDPKRAALCCTLDAFDWRRLKPLLRQSYDLALSQGAASRKIHRES
jgi:predicted DNA-binding protein (MmcQ/YjbR family)